MSIEEVMNIVMDYQAGISTFEELHDAIDKYGSERYTDGIHDGQEY